MAKKRHKNLEKLARRQAAFESIVPSTMTCKMHKPGSQNARKG